MRNEALVLVNRMGSREQKRTSPLRLYMLGLRGVWSRSLLMLFNMPQPRVQLKDQKSQSSWMLSDQPGPHLGPKVLLLSIVGIPCTAALSIQPGTAPHDQCMHACRNGSDLLAAQASRLARHKCWMKLFCQTQTWGLMYLSTSSILRPCEAF